MDSADFFTVSLIIAILIVALMGAGIGGFIIWWFFVR